MNRRCVAAVSVACVLSLSTTARTQQRELYQQTQYKGQEIGKLTGDVYFARMDDYVSAFMVTPEGIVLVEPIGTEMATWLKGELDRRFHVPVKFVIYSHSHWDHASGGAVYADTARFIGHENLIKNIAMPPADTPLPQNVRAQDTNGNGRIEAAEAQGNIKAQFDLYDAESKHGVRRRSDARPIANVRRPDLTYTDALTIRLGGKPNREPRGARARRRQHHRPVRRRHECAVCFGLDHRSPAAVRPDRRRRDRGGEND